MKRLKRMSTRDMWVLVMGIGIGMLAAFPFAAPILGSVIPDATATLWGSALGAMVAVAGAFWVAGSAERSTRRNASSLVLGMMEPLVFFLDELQDAYGHSVSTDLQGINSKSSDLTPSDWKQVRDAAHSASDKYVQIMRNRSRIDGILPSLGPDGVSAVFALEDELEAAMDLVHRIQDEASQTQNKFYTTSTSGTARLALTAHRRHIARDIGTLKRQAVGY